MSPYSTLLATPPILSFSVFDRFVLIVASMKVDKFDASDLTRWCKSLPANFNWNSVLAYMYQMEPQLRFLVMQRILCRENILPIFTHCMNSLPLLTSWSYALCLETLSWIFHYPYTNFPDYTKIFTKVLRKDNAEVFYLLVKGDRFREPNSEHILHNFLFHKKGNCTKCYEVYEEHLREKKLRNEEHRRRPSLQRSC